MHLRRPSLVVAVLASLVSTCSLFATPVPLVNGGFEDGATGWNIQEVLPMTKIDPSAAHTGAAGLLIEDKDPKLGSSAESTPVPCVAGHIYRVNFQARTFGAGGGCAVYLRFRDAAGKTFPNEKALPLVGDAKDWAGYQFDAIAPETAASVALWVHSFGQEIGKWEIDDISMEELDPATGATVAADIKPIAPLPPLPNPLIPVVLKVDDLTSKNGVPERWKRITDFAIERKVKLSIGIIANSLEGDKPAYAAYLADLQKTGLIEFWFHGYDHTSHVEDGKEYPEFGHRDYEEQKRRFDLGQKLATEKLGAPFSTYGNPGGGNTQPSPEDWDASCRVLAETPGMKMWLYPLAMDDRARKLMEGGKVIVLDRVYPVNIEQPLFVPSAEKFISGYLKNAKGRRYYILQGHPNQWDDARWTEFVKLVDYLQANKIPIMTPSELVSSLEKK